MSQHSEHGVTLLLIEDKPALAKLVGSICSKRRGAGPTKRIPNLQYSIQRDETVALPYTGAMPDRSRGGLCGARANVGRAIERHYRVLARCERRQSGRGLVCRHRNAGICSTSTASAATSHWLASCTSVRTGRPVSLASRLRIRVP